MCATYHQVHRTHCCSKMYGGRLGATGQIDIDIYADDVDDEYKKVNSKHSLALIETAGWVYECTKRGEMLVPKVKQEKRRAPAKEVEESRALSRVSSAESAEERKKSLKEKAPSPPRFNPKTTVK